MKYVQNETLIFAVMKQIHEDAKEALLIKKKKKKKNMDDEKDLKLLQYLDENPRKVD